MGARGTARCGGKVVRLLTQEEADAHALEHNPSRRTVIDPETGKPLEENGQFVVETYGQGNPKRLGLYEMSGEGPVPFAPSEEDIYEPQVGEAPRELRSDWEIVANDSPTEEFIEEPAIVDPEIVDDAVPSLAETAIDDAPL